MNAAACARKTAQTSNFSAILFVTCSMHAKKIRFLDHTNLELNSQDQDEQPDKRAPCREQQGDTRDRHNHERENRVSNPSERTRENELGLFRFANSDSPRNSHPPSVNPAPQAENEYETSKLGNQNERCTQCSFVLSWMLTENRRKSYSST
jgi:hypothetical protein